MNELHVDVAVVGTGTAGLAAYRAARAQGKRVVTIDAGPYGTTCARVGCMPSKLLIAAAEAAHMLDRAPGFGVHPGSKRIDGIEVMARVRSERDRFVGFVLESVDGIPAEDKLVGRARFTGPRSLQVGAETTVHFHTAVIATGSHPVIPAALQGVGERVVVNDDVFNWTALPRSVAVIGSGVIGLELGQALHRLGVKTTIYARGRSVAHLRDPEVRHAASAALQEELDIAFNHSVVRAKQEHDAVWLTTKNHEGVETTEAFDYVLCAAGRAPNVEHLGLELAGVGVDARGIPLFDHRTMQCGSSHIFIAGDANHARPVLHEAADDGKIAGDNAARYPDVRPGARRVPLAIAFTEPNLAAVGKGYGELCSQGRFAIGSVSFDNQGRSRVMLQNKGMLRVYGEYGTGIFLGAELAAPRGEHLAHLLAWAAQTRLTVYQMLDLPFYHPVVEEGVRTALRDLAAAIEKGAPSEPSMPDCTPGN